MQWLGAIMTMLKSRKKVGALKDTRCVICMSHEARCMGAFYWCSECEFRARLLAWGQQHNYPDLQLGSYAIGPGLYCWEVACLVANEELVWLGLAYIEVHDAA